METVNTISRESEYLGFDRDFERVPLPFPSEAMASHSVATVPRTDLAERDFSAFLEEQLRNGSNSLYADAMAWMERRLLVRVLAETNGNKSKACQILGITRGSLRHKIAQLGISIHQTVSVDKTSDL